jgi:hypothetical protein
MALYQACETGDLKKLNDLLAINTYTQAELNSALVTACYYEHLHVAKTLVAKYSTGGLVLGRALIYVCIHDKPSAAKYLISKGPKDLNAAFFYACLYRHLGIVVLLLNAGANEWTSLENRQIAPIKLCELGLRLPVLQRFSPILFYSIILFKAVIGKQLDVWFGTRDLVKVVQEFSLQLNSFGFYQRCPTVHGRWNCIWRAFTIKSRK